MALDFTDLWNLGPEISPVWDYVQQRLTALNPEQYLQQTPPSKIHDQFLSALYNLYGHPLSNPELNQAIQKLLLAPTPQNLREVVDDVRFTMQYPGWGEFEGNRGLERDFSDMVGDIESYINSDDVHHVLGETFRHLPRVRSHSQGNNKIYPQDNPIVQAGYGEEIENYYRNVLEAKLDLISGALNPQFTQFILSYLKNPRDATPLLMASDWLEENFEMDEEDGYLNYPEGEFFWRVVDHVIPNSEELNHPETRNDIRGLQNWLQGGPKNLDPEDQGLTPQRPPSPFPETGPITQGFNSQEEFQQAFDSSTPAGQANVTAQQQQQQPPLQGQPPVPPSPEDEEELGELPEVGLDEEGNSKLSAFASLMGKVVKYEYRAPQQTIDRFGMTVAPGSFGPSAEPQKPPKKPTAKRRVPLPLGKAQMSEEDQHEDGIDTETINNPSLQSEMLEVLNKWRPTF